MIFRWIWKTLNYTPGPGPERPGPGASQAAWDTYKKKRRTHYNAQIRSGSGRDNAKATRAAAGDRCQRCRGAVGEFSPDGNIITHLEAHHLHYRNFGFERREDMKAVCPHCHEIEDELRKRKRR